MPGRVHFHSSLPTNEAHGWNFQSSSEKLSLRCESQSLITTLRSSAGIKQQWRDPLAALSWMADHPGTTSTSRWAGYLSYELARLFESLPTIATDDLHLPLFCFSLYESGTQATATQEMPTPTYDDLQTYPLSTLPKPMYLQRTARVIDYINAGDVFQVNLAQRFTAPLTITPEQIRQNLLTRTPASYGAYLHCGDHAIISNSPELFLHVTRDRRIITRPIKGTRPNQPGMYGDLLHSQKDQAELNMIIDLERNDLGRICELGSVRVTQRRTIEMHPTVYHGVATIEGRLSKSVSFIEMLRATFPGGSVTGAPKIRAMQIIEELEPVRRGPYCGAIGYLAADGSMQFNVAIRTIIAMNGQAYIPVGGGIVADSDPLEEYEETITKAAAMFAALKK